MLTTSRWILRILNWLNWGLGVPAVIFLLVLGFAQPALFADALAEARPEYAADAFFTTIRWVALITAPIIPLAHIILTRLIAMIDSVPLGTALSLLNAERLRQIAWALIGINILDLAFGAVSLWAASRETENFDWILSLTGWIAALLLFVLARIFREGAAMREELEGTV